MPDSVGPIVFWYNRELCKKAGVDPSEVKHWEDLLEAAKKCKAAGIIPMAVEMHETLYHFHEEEANAWLTNFLVRTSTKSRAISQECDPPV